MIKRYIKIAIFFIITWIFFGKGIDAYNLNFYARESSDGKYYVFSTSVGASEHSKNEFIKKAISLGINPVLARERLYMTPVGHVGDGKTGEYLGGDSYYDVTGLLVHKKNYGNLQLFSNYKSENEKDVEIYYDVFSGDASISNYLENVTSGKGRVGERKIGNSTVNPNFVYYQILNENLNTSSKNNKFYTKYTISKDGSKVIYEYYISKEALEDNINYVEYVDGKITYRKYAISLQLTTLRYASVDNPRIIETSYDFYRYFFLNGHDFSPGNKGMDYSGNWVKGTSSANDMDNYLYVYDSGENLLDGTVIVNHIIHLSNGDTKLISNGKEKVAGQTQGTGSENRTYTFTNFKINKVVPVVLETKNVEYENKKYTCKEADVRYSVSNNSTTGYSINSPIYVNLTDYDNEIHISYHYYPENYREIYVGYFDEEGNKLDFSPMKRRDYYEDKKNNYTIRNQLYGYQDNYEEKYSTESSLYIEPIVTNPTIGETNYSLKGVQINKSDSSNYKNLIGTEDGSFYSNSALIDQKSYTVDADGKNYYVAFIYKKGEVKQPKLFYSYVGVELDEENGGYKFVEKLEGPYEKDNTGADINISTKDKKFSGYDPNPLGCVSRLDGQIGTVYEDLFYEDIVNTKLYPVNKEKGINFEGAKHKDNNSLIVVLYLKYKPITYNLFVYRRAIDENNRIQNENLKIGINPEENKVTASIGTVKSIAEKEDRKYTITLEDDRKTTKVTVKNILESDMSEDQIIEYKFSGKWSRKSRKTTKITKTTNIKL